MAQPDPERREGAPSHIHIEKKKGINWLAWILLALGILALLIALSRCHRDDQSTAPPTAPTAPVSAPTAAQPSAASGSVVGATPTAVGSAATPAGTSTLGNFLAGGEPTPRTFVFEKLNFDTGKSDVRPPDAADVQQVADTLKQYPTARIRIAGYADARGSEAPNTALGAARAQSVKAALVAAGINAGRIETVSGGENVPVASNATASGRFENRRTELVVTAR